MERQKNKSKCYFRMIIFLGSGIGSSIFTTFSNSQKFLVIQDRRIEVFSNCAGGLRSFSKKKYDGLGLCSEARTLSFKKGVGQQLFFTSSNLACYRRPSTLDGRLKLNETLFFNIDKRLFYHGF